MAVLPDVLEPGLKVVICGTAAGNESAARGSYYAQPNNQFWDVLYRVGLTPRRLHTDEYQLLPKYGIGLTDLAKLTHGGDKQLKHTDFDVDGFKAKILRYAPVAVAFNGKQAAQQFFGRKYVDYGRQRDGIGSSVLFVLPSTSGLARRFWDEGRWRELAALVPSRWSI
jgi:TDG/mug DNA glycosylase family protein